MMRMNKTAALSGAVILLGLSACEKVPNAENADTPAAKAELANLVDTLADADDLSDARALIEAAGLDMAFEGDAPYTLFLPSNQALESVNEDELDRLKSDEGRPELIALLRYHIAPGVMTQQDLLNAIDGNAGSVTIANVAGANLDFARQGRHVGIGSGDQAAMITASPLTAGNGVIYTIDRLIAPQDPEDATGETGSGEQAGQDSTAGSGIS